jgi:hypothetical protein
MCVAAAGLAETSASRVTSLRSGWVAQKLAGLLSVDGSTGGVLRSCLFADRAVGRKEFAS